MFNYSPQTYKEMFDALLSQELMYGFYDISSESIFKAMKRVLGSSIRQNVIKGYSNLNVDYSCNVSFMIKDLHGSTMPVTLFCGQ